MKNMVTFLRKRGPLAGVLFVATVKLLEVFGYADAARGLATIGGVFGVGTELPADLVVGLAAGAAGLGAAYKSFMVSRAWLRTPSLKVLIAVTLLGGIYACSGGGIPVPDPTTCTGPAPGPDCICLPIVGWQCPAPPGEPKDCSAAASKASGFVAVKSKNVVEGAFVVTLKGKAPRLAAAQVESLVSSLSTKYGLQNVVAHSSLGSFSTRGLSLGAVSKLMLDPSVLRVQPMTKLTLPTPVSSTVGAQALQGNLDRIDQKDLPLDGKYEPGSTGAGVDIYIVDTGCPSDDLKTCKTNHPEFGARYVAAGFTAITYQGVFDANGHATHVAGIAAGNSFGVAKGAKLHGVRVLDDKGSGDTGTVNAGLNFVLEDCKPGMRCVVNMSLGGGVDPELDAAVCKLDAAGIAVVVAAGNDGSDARDTSPAHVVQCWTTAASDHRNDRAASFSNFGAIVDGWAPGVDIESATPTGGSITHSGTSMAAPHVAGAVAVAWERHAGFTAQQVLIWLRDHASPGKIGTAPADTTQALLYVRE